MSRSERGCMGAGEQADPRATAVRTCLVLHSQYKHAKAVKPQTGYTSATGQSACRLQLALAKVEGVLLDPGPAAWEDTSYASGK